LHENLLLKGFASFLTKCLRTSFEIEEGSLDKSLATSQKQIHFSNEVSITTLSDKVRCFWLPFVLIDMITPFLQNQQP
jgi:hypothetical protein